MNFDLNSLPGEILFYSNDLFFSFVEKCLGSDELHLIKIQGIKNTRALIHIPDIMAILDLDCDEIDDLRKKCFNTKNKGFVVKEGVKCGIIDFIESAKKKNSNYVKQLKRIKIGSQVESNDQFNDNSSS